MINLHLCHNRFINIEPSAVDEERDTVNVSDEENRGNVTLPEQDMIISSSTVPGEVENPNISTTNTTMDPPLSTILWSGLNVAKKTVCISPNLKILIFNKII